MTSVSDSPCLILTHETDNRKLKQQRQYHDMIRDYGCMSIAQINVIDAFNYSERMKEKDKFKVSV